MEKIIDKLGLYDIWIILFPGAFLCISIKSVYNFMITLSDQIQAFESQSVIGKLLYILSMNIYSPNTAYELLVILLCSYMTGVVLHEISSIFKKNIMFRKGTPIDLILIPKSNILSETEMERMMPLFTSVNGGELAKNEKELKKQSRFVFHKINATLQRRKLASQYAKLNVIYNMSATFCVDIFVLFVIFIFFTIEFLLMDFWSVFYMVLIPAIILIVVFVMLWKRSRKYYRYWVRNMIFAYEDSEKEYAENNAAADQSGDKKSDDKDTFIEK